MSGMPWRRCAAFSSAKHGGRPNSRRATQSPESMFERSIDRSLDQSGMKLRRESNMTDHTERFERPDASGPEDSDAAGRTTRDKSEGWHNAQLDFSKSM